MPGTSASSVTSCWSARSWRMMPIFLPLSSPAPSRTPGQALVLAVLADRDVRGQREQAALGRGVEAVGPAVHRDGEHVVVGGDALDHRGRERRGEDHGERLVVLGGLHARLATEVGVEDGVGSVEHVRDQDRSVRPATPPWALMSATTAFIVFSASPISGARCCDDQLRQVGRDHRDRDGRRGDADGVAGASRRACRWSSRSRRRRSPTWRCTPPATRTPPLARRTQRQLVRIRIADPPGHDVERLIETNSET